MFAFVSGAGSSACTTLALLQLFFSIVVEMSARLSAIASGAVPGAVAGLAPHAPPANAADNSDFGVGLRSYLLREYQLGKMDGVQMCTIAHHVTRAGGQGVSDLAVEPGNRHAADHIRGVLGSRCTTAFYVARVPMWCKTSERRQHLDFPVNLPHEEFAACFADRPEELKIDVDSLEPGDLPDRFYQHPVYDRHGAKTCPLGLFSDGVPYTKQESMIAFYWSSLLAPRRHLICAIRKSDLCRCGCKGLCTLGAVQRIIAWSFSVIQSGKWPEFDHMGRSLLLNGEEARAAKAGQDLADGHCGALVEMRADLEEYCASMGFKRWSVKQNPCWCCTTKLAEFYDFPAFVEGSPWNLHARTAGTYAAEIANCLVQIEVAADDDMAEISAKLRFDRRKDGHGGLCLTEATRGLPKGARLMEAGPVIDLHAVQDIPTPCTLTFFDTKGDHGMNFVYPLFAIEGFTIDSLTLDVMHVLDLGCTQWMVGRVFRLFIQKNFAFSTAEHAYSRDVDNLKHLRRRMWAYYKNFPAEGNTKSSIHKLTFKMLGKKSCPKLSSKAAEARHILGLCSMLFRENEDLLAGPQDELLRQSCLALNEMYRIMREEDRRMTLGGFRTLRDAMCEFLVTWKLSGGHVVPKHHFAWHLAERAATNGNPRFSWTYIDEQENRAMGTVAKSLWNGPTWYRSFLQKVLAEVCATRS